jgi:hypothetical protein
MRAKIYCFLFLLLPFHLLIFTYVTKAMETSMEQTPTILDLSDQNKEAAQTMILNQILEKYKQNKTFTEIQKYTTLRFHDLKKNQLPRKPELLVTEAFAKSQAMYKRTKPFIGYSFNRLYQPQAFEELVDKYLWLKGVCFLVLGIKEDHKIGVSYFYLPQNTALRREILKDIVHYSFPEVVETPENQAWFISMGDVMDRLGYKIFDVEKYCPNRPTLISSM